MNKFLRSVASISLALSAFAFFSCEDDDVIGLDDAARYGNIVVTLEGTRTDDVAFTEKLNFRFIEGESLQGSAIYKDGDYNYFSVRRFLSAVNYDYSDNYAGITMEVDNSGDSPVFEGIYLYISTLIISESDHKSFYFSQEEHALEEEDITSYSYNAETGKLVIKFTETIAADSNDTGHELTITGTISVTVFEYVGE